MLALTQLCGFMAGAKGPPELSFLQVNADDTNLTTYSFASVNIGAEDATRRVVVCVHWHIGAAARVLNSATIAGVAATIHQQGTANAGNCAIISALVPTGTTATIAFTLDGSAERGAIATYRAINESVATPHATMVDNAIGAGTGVFTGTLNVPANGWAVACSQPSAAGTPITGAAWVGVTEQYDNAYGDAAGVFRSGGFVSGLPAETARTVSCTWSAAILPTGGRMAAMSWG